MMKSGVIARGPFADAALERERNKRGWWPFAYTLLGDIEENYEERDDALLERLYGSMRAGDGVYKITRRDRFGELDACLAEEIGRRFKEHDSVRVHDMAASNAITSLELFRRLRSDARVRVHATDYYDAIHVVSFPDTTWRVVLDADDRPLQLVGPHFVLSAYRAEPLRYPINRIVQAVVKRRLLPRASRMSMRRSHAEDGLHTRRITLFHPACVALAKSEPRFSLGRDNLFAPHCDPFDVVRVMNVLTARHFPEDQAMAGIAAVGKCIAEGGLLALGRNVDEAGGQLRATLFERRGRRLLGVRGVGEGEELCAAVEGLDLRD